MNGKRQFFAWLRSNLGWILISLAFVMSLAFSWRAVAAAPPSALTPLSSEAPPTVTTRALEGLEQGKRVPSH